MAQYKIQQGDTLSALARRYGTTVDALMDANQQIKDRDLIYYDRMMNVPGAATPVTVTPPADQGAIAGMPTHDMIDGIPVPSDMGKPFLQPVHPSVDQQIAGMSNVEMAGGMSAGVDLSGQPTLQELGKSAWDWFKRPAPDEGQIPGASNIEYDPNTGMPVGLGVSGQPTLQELGAGIFNALEPVAANVSEKVAKATENATKAVNKAVDEAPDAIKGGITNFLNEDVGAVINGLDRADQYIKSGELGLDVTKASKGAEKLITKYADIVKKYASEGAESLAKNTDLIRKDFLYTLSEFVQDNNLDTRSIVETIDVDWLYAATGVRNKKKERAEKIRLAKIERERQRRMAALQNMPEGQYGTYAGGGLVQQAQNVAAQGRYGDSMLMHVNPAEVAGLSQVMPITTNPETGQPEAFLPFLVPLLGSLAGGALGTAGMLGGSIGTIGGAALGSGLATFAQTGDAQKGLLAGLTGYGLGKLLPMMGGPFAAKEAAGAAGAATTPVVSGDTLSGLMGTHGGNQAAWMAANPSITNPNLIQAGSTLNIPGSSAGAQPFSWGALGTAASKPGTFVPMLAGSSGLGMMESQEQFAQQMADLKRKNEAEYNRMIAEHPEYVPMLQGNRTFAAQGGRIGYQGGGGLGGGGGGGGNVDRKDKEWKPTQAIEALPISPFYQSGFQPEMSYFKNLNPSSAQIRSGFGDSDWVDAQNQIAGGVSPITDQQFRPFDPTQTAGYQSFYNAPRSPYVVDPYAPMDYENQPRPYDPPVYIDDPIFEPLPVVEEPVVEQPIIDIPTPVGPAIPSEEIDIGDWSDPTGYDEMMDTGVPMDQYGDPIEPTAIWNNQASGTAGYTAPSTYTPDITDLNREELETLGLDIPPVAPAPVIPAPVVQPPVVPSMVAQTGPVGGQGAVAPPNLGGMGLTLPPPSAIPDIPSTIPIDPSTLAPISLGLTPEELEGAYAPPPVFAPPVVAPPAVTEEEVLPQERRIDRSRGGGRRRKAEGGRTGYQNQGVTEVSGEVINPVEAEAGVSIMDDPLTQEVVLFILGESGNQEVVSQFLAKYGNEAFMQLRNSVLQQLAPDAQTEGQIAGTGGGGMADDINGVIGNQEQIAVSQDEFIVPADVVSMLGDGSSDAGADQLYGMMDRVRKAKTGTTRQAPRLANAGGLLPA